MFLFSNLSESHLKKKLCKPFKFVSANSEVTQGGREAGILQKHCKENEKPIAIWDN